MWELFIKILHDPIFISWVSGCFLFVAYIVYTKLFDGEYKKEKMVEKKIKIFFLCAGFLLVWAVRNTVLWPMIKNLVKSFF